jgi:hypothetical protein
MSTDRLLKEKQAELDLIRGQIDEIEDLPEPEGQEALRSQINAERDAKVDSLIARHKELLAEIKPLQDRVDELDAIRSAARDQARVESGDGSRRTTNRSPQVMRRVEPYEGLELVRAGVVGREDMIGRAKSAVDNAPQHLSDDSREKVTQLLEDEGKHAPLISRHILLTGSDEYHRQFQEYIENRGAYAGDAMRAALSLTDANGGRVAALVG